MAQITNDERARRDGIIDRAERTCRVAFAEALAEFGDAYRFRRARIVVCIIDNGRRAVENFSTHAVLGRLELVLVSYRGHGRGMTAGKGEG